MLPSYRVELNFPSYLERKHLIQLYKTLSWQMTGSNEQEGVHCWQRSCVVMITYLEEKKSLSGLCDMA